MRYVEISEARTAPIYHALGNKKAVDVFTNDHMLARWEHDIPGMGKRSGNSFSRNHNMMFGQQNDAISIRLVVDQDKLSRRHRIIPLDAENVFNHSYGGNPQSTGFSDRKFHSHDEHFAEEFVIGDIRNLHDYLIGIEFRNAVFPFSNTRDLLDLVTAYSEKFAVPLSVNPKVTKALADQQAAWDEDDE